MMDNFLDHNLEAEQGIISGLLRISDYDSDVFQKTIGTLKTGAFYSLSHRKSFEAIKQIGKKTGRVDLLTLTDYLEKTGEIDDCGGFAYFGSILSNNPSTANMSGYVRIVKEYAVERFSVQKMNELMVMFTDRSNGDVYQRLGLIESMVSDISNLGLKSDSGGLKHITESLTTWLDNIEQIQSDGYDKNAFTTGIESLDDILGVKGMRRGSLVGVGARPKMGKSAFMMLLANHFALNLKEPTAIFSMEMPDHEIAERGMTSRTTLCPTKFYREHSSEIQGRTDTAFNEFLESNLLIDDGTSLTLSHILRECRKMHREKGSLGLVCIDYLTLMKAEKAERNDLAYGIITKALKNLAKELNCVVLLLTQLNRGLESRPDKRPMPSDSRDTGQLEQDVDMWIGLYKESVYSEEVQHKGLTEVLVRLNRHGGTGTAFVEMREGFHVPLDLQEGAKQQHAQTMDKQKPEQQTEFRIKKKKES